MQHTDRFMFLTFKSWGKQRMSQFKDFISEDIFIFEFKGSMKPPIIDPIVHRTL